jgi:hypothetical protein
LAKIKHIHVVAEDGGEGKTDLTAVILSYEQDGSGVSEEYKTFLLPEETSKLSNFTDSLFSSNNPPSNVDKNKFKQDIVDYSLNIATKSVDYTSINDYYNNILNSEEVKNSVPTQNSLDDLKTLLSELDNEQQENLTIYDSSINSYTSETSEIEINSDSLDNSDSFSAEDFSETAGLEIEPEEDLLVYEATHTIQNRLVSVDLDDQTPEGSFVKTQREIFGDKPTEGGQRPVVDLTNMSFQKTRVFANLSDSSTVALRGVGGARLIEPVPEPIYYPGDAYLKSENNSGIICSRDEHYRLRGHTKSGAVYIYAGRNGSLKSEFEEYSNPDLVKKPQRNNLISDSSYIYISQKADIDSLYKFKLARGSYSKATSKLTKNGEKETRLGMSLAAIKADDVILMSRVSGIRLITGTDVKNSKGGTQSSKFGIDLIAGNDDSDLQPLVKGNNLVEYLAGLSKSIDDIRKVLYDFINSQSKFNSVIAEHTHWDQFGIFLGTAGPKNPLAINGGKGLPSSELGAAGASKLLATMRQQANTVSAIMNQIGNDNNALTKTGVYSILSEKNRTN